MNQLLLRTLANVRVISQRATHSTVFSGGKVNLVDAAGGHLAEGPDVISMACAVQDRISPISDSSR